MNTPPISYQRMKVCCCFGNPVGRDKNLALGTDFGFKSQQLNFEEIRKFLVKLEGNEFPLRQEKTRAWRSHISANAIKVRTKDGKPLGK